MHPRVQRPIQRAKLAQHGHGQHARKAAVARGKRAHPGTGKGLIQTGAAL
jgi:hypothetical protein